MSNPLMMMVFLDLLSVSFSLLNVFIAGHSIGMVKMEKNKFLEGKFVIILIKEKQISKVAF